MCAYSYALTRHLLRPSVQTAPEGASEPIEQLLIAITIAIINSYYY